MTNEEFYKEKIYDAIARSMAVSEDGKIAIVSRLLVRIAYSGKSRGW